MSDTCRRQRMIDAKTWFDHFYYWSMRSPIGGPGNMVPDEENAAIVRYALDKQIKQIEEESHCMIQESKRE